MTARAATATWLTRTGAREGRNLGLGPGPARPNQTPLRQTNYQALPPFVRGPVLAQHLDKTTPIGMPDPHHAANPTGGLLASSAMPDSSLASSETGTSTPTFTNPDPASPYGPAPPRPPPDRQTNARGKLKLAFEADARPWAERSFVYQWRPLRGMWADLRRRAPFYWSDWTEAGRRTNWERTAAGTVRIYFLK